MEKFNKYKPSDRAKLNKYLTQGGPTKTAIELRNQLNKDPVSFEKQIEAKTKELSEDMITEKQRTPGKDILRNILIEEMKHRDLDQDEIKYMVDTKDRSEVATQKINSTGQKILTKTPGVTPKAKPNEHRKIAQYIKNTQKPFYKIKHKPVKLDFDPLPIVSLKETPEEKAQRENFEKILEDHNRDKAKRVNGGLAYLIGSPLIPESPERNNDNVKPQNQEEDI